MSKITIKKPKLNKPKFSGIGMPKFDNITALVSKEIKQYFSSPLGYIVLGVAVALHMFIFMYFSGFFETGIADLSSYFGTLPWIFVPLIPALTMGTIASEKNEGTIEYLLTRPVSIFELLASKLLSVALFVCMFFAVEFLLLITILSYGSFDYGQLLAQYISSLFLALSLASFGIFVSGLIKGQVGSFLVTLFGIFLILILGFEGITLRLPIIFASYLERLSILTHFNSMTRGAIDLNDLLYFLGFTSFFSLLTYYNLVTDRFPSKSAQLNTVRISTLLLLIVVILITGFGQKIPGRLDLTKNKINSLTDSSKDVVSNLDKEVTIEVYYSSNLPANYQTVKRDMFSVLRDYDRAGNDNLKIEYKAVDLPEQIDAAQMEGIQPLNFREIGYGTYESSLGVLGMVIKSGGDENLIEDANVESLDEADIPTESVKQDVIGSVLDTSNLEYEITSIIKNQTSEDRKTIGVLDTKVKNTFASMAGLNSLLSREYQIRSVIFDGENRSVPEDIDALIIAGPNEEMSEDMVGAIMSYFENGGTILLLNDTVNIELQFGLFATDNPSSLANMFEEKGITIDPGLVYDLQSSVLIGLKPYRYFSVAQPASDHQVVRQSGGVLMPWMSSISIDDSKTEGLEVVKLLESTEYAGKEVGEYNIDLDYDIRDIDQTELSQYTLAVAINETDENPGRAIIVSDSDLILDQENILSSFGNELFVTSGIEWLVQDESLASIRTKDRVADPLLFPNILIPAAIQLAGPFVLLILIAGAGTVGYLKRKRLMTREYDLEKL